MKRIRADIGNERMRSDERVNSDNTTAAMLH
jgi:hypothetical protein